MASRLPLILSCALLAGAAQAAELGEPRVSSFIGQPLVADIELTMLEDGANPVQVRLAHPDVYRGANIGMPAVLSTLRLSVMRRDGRQFLHITSLGAVESEHLHLYLELADGSQRSVRLATLWLTPDPQPAPPPVPVAPPLPARAVEPQPAPESAPRPAAARPARAAAPAEAPRPTPPAKQASAALAACAPQPRTEVDACVVLGEKNAMLRAQLGQLEDKVELLRVAAGAAPAMPQQVHRPKKKKPEPPKEEGSSWALAGVGGAVLALLAGLVFYLRRARAGGRGGAARAGLLARLGALAKTRGGRKPAPAPLAEPGLEARAHDSSTQL